MVIGGSREAHGARVTVTLKHGELWFHGIALKQSASKVVPLEV